MSKLFLQIWPKFSRVLIKQKGLQSSACSPVINSPHDNLCCLYNCNCNALCSEAFMIFHYCGFENKVEFNERFYLIAILIQVLGHYGIVCEQWKMIHVDTELHSGLGAVVFTFCVIQSSCLVYGLWRDYGWSLILKMKHFVSEMLSRVCRSIVTKTPTITLLCPYKKKKNSTRQGCQH